MRGTCSALLAVAAFACAGCAEIRVRTTPRTLDETVLRERTETVIGPDLTAEVRQVGSHVTLVASRQCADHAMRDVRRTVRHEHYDANAAGTRRLGIAGGVIAAFGGLLSSLPALPARTDHGADLGFGVPLAMLGTTLAVAAIVGVARARGSDEVEEETRVDQGALTPVHTCAIRHPVRFEPVVGRLAPAGTVPLPLGTTNEDGQLEIDLKRLPAAAVKAAPEPKRLVFYIQESAVGQASLVLAAREADDDAWTEAQVDDGGCGAPFPAAQCWRYHRYLDGFPEGVHADEARATIQRHEALTEQDVVAALAWAKAAEQARVMAARREAAVETASTAARGAAARTCQLTCQARCNGDAACAEACTGQSCDGSFLRRDGRAR